MPTAVKFKWLNDGEETLLENMPIGGMREIVKVKRDRAKLTAALTQSRFIILCRSIMAANKVMQDFGVEKAHAAWTATIDQEFGEMAALKFPLETFREDLTSWLEDFVLTKLGVNSLKEAKEELERQTEDANKYLKTQEASDFVDVSQDLYLLEMYWRLRATGISEIKTPEGAKKLDWSISEKHTTMDVIGEVLTEEDMLQLYKANGRAAEELDMEDLLPLSAADVRGKARKTSKPSTESSVNSDASSEHSMEAAEKSS